MSRAPSATHGDTRPRAVLAVGGFALAVLAAAGAAGAGPGTRIGLWEYNIGLSILLWCAAAGPVAAVLSALGGLQARPGGRRRGMRLALAGCVIGLAVPLLPGWWAWVSTHVPPIHDVTTDLDDPPRFEALRAEREQAPNAVDYNETFADIQRQAYPDLQSRYLPQPPDEAFDTALAAARVQGWDIVAADRDDGRVEAVATSFWFGFKDDVVIRVVEAERGARLDVRSASRVGRGDLGANARRIRDYLDALDVPEAGHR